MGNSTLAVRDGMVASSASAATQPRNDGQFSAPYPQRTNPYGNDPAANRDPSLVNVNPPFATSSRNAATTGAVPGTWWADGNPNDPSRYPAGSPRTGWADGSDTRGWNTAPP